VGRQILATIHIQPTAALAERVLLPGDPGRALALAQALLGEPKMFNHNRGLWGYTGAGADGEPLTIQSTGMGGPSAAIVVAELIELGARRFIRVGTCGAVAPSLELGDLVIATTAYAEDGTSRALGADNSISASAEIVEALARAAADRAVVGAVVCTDLFYDGPEDREQRWLERGALAFEMETATLFALAARRGVAAGSLLAVTDALLPKRLRIDPDALADAERRMGEIAAAALA
jgi:DeoD family purine-nucleoside phosphorylase